MFKRMPTLLTILHLKFYHLCNFYHPMITAIYSKIKGLSYKHCEFSCKPLTCAVKTKLV